MPVAEVQFYDVIKWLHVSAVVVGLGATFAYGVFIAVASRRCRCVRHRALAPSPRVGRRLNPTPL